MVTTAAERRARVRRAITRPGSLAVAAALWVFRRGYAGLRWSWSWPAVAVGAVVFAVWMALEPAPTGRAVGRGRGAWRGSPRPLAALWLAARVIGSVVTVPIAEELAFRGYLTRRLIAADFTAVSPGRFTWLSFVVSSLPVRRACTAAGSPARSPGRSTPWPSTARATSPRPSWRTPPPTP